MRVYRSSFRSRSFARARASMDGPYTLLSQRKVKQTHVTGQVIERDDTGIDLAKPATARGLRIQLNVDAQDRPNASLGG